MFEHAFLWFIIAVLSIIRSSAKFTFKRKKGKLVLVKVTIGTAKEKRKDSNPKD